MAERLYVRVTEINVQRCQSKVIIGLNNMQVKQVLPGTKKSPVSSIFENGKEHTENLSDAKIMNQ